MKVVQIITRLIQGGAQAHVVELCEFLRREGRFEVTLVGGPPSPHEGDCIDRARRAGIPIVVVEELVRPISPWLDWRAGRALRRLLEGIKPDVVHTHSAKAGVLGRRAARQAGVPGIFHTLHGLPFHPDQSFLVKEAGAWFERHGAGLSTRIVCVGRGVRDAVSYWGIAPDEKVVTIPCGVDLGRFEARHATRADLGLPEGGRLVVVPARLAVGKGHDLLLWAADQPQLRLVFVGDGPLRASLEERARSLGRSLTVTGMVPPERVPAYLAAADVVALPSSREGMPLALLEGALAGRPLLGLDIDANREIVRHGDNGLLAAPDRLGEALADLLGRLDHFARGAALLLPDLRLRYDKERTLPQIAALYDS
jgi:glycosyltransferase involved in cell wall biosynthesis